MPKMAPRLSRNHKVGRVSPSAPPQTIPDHDLTRCGEVWLASNVMGTYRTVKVVYRVRNFHPFLRSSSQIRMPHGEELLAGETGTGSVLVDDFCEGRRRCLDRGPQFPGAKQSARDEEGRPGFLLPQRQ